MRLPTGQYFGTTDRQIEFEGLRFSTTEYEPLQEQPWHTHERATFFSHLAGGHLDESERAEWSLPPLGVTYHSPSTLHRSRLGPGGARGVNLALSDGWLESREIAPRDLGQHRVSWSERVRSAVLLLVRTYTPAPLGSRELSDMALELAEGFVIPSFAKEPALPRWLTQTEDRLRADFRQPIGLSRLAREANVHPVHLARVFRERHGRSVTEQLQRLRVQAAVERVLEGDSIGNAALDAGFADQSHFSRTLKAHFGYSPNLVKRLRAAPPRCCERS
jgi:AraC family transcriptional regulator